MSDLIRLTAADLASKLASREVSSVEVTKAHLDRIAGVDADVHAFLHVSENALATAKAIDERRAAGESLGELAGVPIAIKDVLCTLDMPSTSGSKILEGWIPPYDATVVAKLRAADLVPLGKTNMDEFAMGSSTENSRVRRRPAIHGISRASPGGSSGGSRRRPSPRSPVPRLALGSDTGGSIRQPGASFTGTFGVKPTYGSRKLALRPRSRSPRASIRSDRSLAATSAATRARPPRRHQAGHDGHDATSLTDEPALVRRLRPPGSRLRRELEADVRRSASSAS